MLEAIAAERVKLLGHRATWFLVWIFPVGLTLLFLAIMAWQLTRGEPPSTETETAAEWIRDSAFAWEAPYSGVGRLLVGAFAAVAFGGEYGWNTWKLVAPHRARAALLVAKYAVVLGLLMLSFTIMAVLAVVLGVLGEVLTGGTVPDGITPGAMFAVHGRQWMRVLLSTALTVAYASTVAVLARSTLAGAVSAVVAVTAEGLAGQFAPLINRTVFEALPTYHLANLSSWVTTGAARELPLPTGVLEHGWPVSLFSYALWAGGLAALTVVAFRRQDLN